MLAFPRCGPLNQAGTRFCRDCGLALDEVATVSRPAPVAVSGPATGEEAPTGQAQRAGPMGEPAGPRPAGEPVRTVSANGGRGGPEDTGASPAEEPAPRPARARSSKSAWPTIGTVAAALLFGAALFALGYALRSEGVVSEPAAAPVPTATLSPQAALRATIQADTRAQSTLSVAVGPNGLSTNLPWSGSLTFPPGAVSDEITVTVERLPDPEAPGDLSLPGPARLFLIKAERRDTGEPVNTFSGRVTLTGVGQQCLLHLGNGEFEPSEGRSLGGGLIECVIPRPGIVAIQRS